MLSEISYETFAEWRAFDRIDPIGGKRGDWQVASVISTLLNLHMARLRKRKTFSPEDFLLEWQEAARPVMERDVSGPRKSWQEMKSIGRMVAAFDNAEIRKAHEREQRAAEKRKKRNG
jgi:outer membrane receptor for ferric coprogen and ferric-rhodotorulic acid